MLCAPQTPRRQKRLFCRYHHGNRTPQLLIAPFKEEDEWDSPHIVRYYDVMSDEEINRIKEIAKPKVGVSAGPFRVTHLWYCGAVSCFFSLAGIWHEFAVGILRCCRLSLTLLGPVGDKIEEPMWMARCHDRRAQWEQGRPTVSVSSPGGGLVCAGR